MSIEETQAFIPPESVQPHLTVVETEVQVNPRLLLAARKILILLEGDQIKNELENMSAPVVEDQILAHTSAFVESITDTPSGRRRAEFAERRLRDHLRGKADKDIAEAAAPPIGRRPETAKTIREQRAEFLKQVSQHVGGVTLRMPLDIEAIPVVPLETAIEVFGRKHTLNQVEVTALRTRLDETTAPAKLTGEVAASLRTLGASFELLERKQPDTLSEIERKVLAGLTGRKTDGTVDSDGLTLRQPLALLAASLQERLQAESTTASQVVASALNKLNHAELEH